jgi:hypothetical protein
MTFIPNINGIVSTNNSGTLTPITISSVSFTGTYELVKDYTSIVVSIIISSNEQVTLTVNFSTNLSGTLKTTENITITGPETHIIPIKSDYLQLVVTNITAITSGSVIDSILTTGSMKLPVEPLSRTLKSSSDSTVTKSVIHGITSRGSYNPLSITSSGLANVNIKDPLDAFSRIRTSNPYTLFSSAMLTTQDNWNYDTLITGSATGTYNQGYPHFIMSTTGTGRIVRQQHGYTIYQPGKSLFLLMTGTIINSAAPNTCSGRIGYFDNSSDKTAATDNSPTGDGFFFQAVGNGTTSPTMSIIYRTSNRISGAIVQTDTSIPQASWNMDPLNGTGSSGLTVNFTNRQIFFIEMEWLGTGDVVLGVFNDRTPIHCHQFKFTNGQYAPNGPGGVPYPQLAYSTRGSLPIRYELESTGGSSTMYQVCSSSISEGGFEPYGKTYSVSSNIKTLAVVGTEYQVISLRLNSTNTYPMRPRTILRINSINLTCTSSGNILYKVYYFKNPSPSPVSGGTWVNGSTNTSGIKYSSAEFNASLTGTGIPSSTTYDVKCIFSGIFSTSTNTTYISFREPIIISSDISGLTDMLLLTCNSVATTNETVYANISWDEYE